MRMKRNPRAVYDDEVSCDLEHVQSMPFLSAIVNQETSRIYTFNVTATEYFKVVAELPFEDDTLKQLSILGSARPHEITNALAFVNRNETEFVNAIYRSSADRKKIVFSNDSFTTR